MTAPTAYGRDVPDEFLPWEHRGAARGIGICLSGGGLRAASFSLGAVQALQHERGLLFGKGCADHLAVVSGGSYLGAAQMLNDAWLSNAADGGVPPLAPGTPEAAHVVSHGSYMKKWSTVSKMALGGLVNFLAFVALFAWAGVMLSGAIAVADAVGIERAADSTWQVVLAVVFVLGGRVTLRGLYLAGGLSRVVLPLVGGAVLVATSASALAVMREVDALSEPSWWTHDWRLPLALGAGAVVVGVSLGLAHVWPHGGATRVVAWLAARLPALVGGVLFCLIATNLAGRVDRGLAADATAHDILVAAAIVFGTLIAAYIMQVIARTSLHGMYRDSLATCFSVRRNAGVVEHVGSTAQRLSELRPPAPGQQGSFPRLLVCATANIVWNAAHPDRSPLFKLPSRDNRRFASFVYSHDRCGLPGVPNASIDTEDLERLTTRSGIFGGREPVVSLMSAVASTGAAVSPAMGRRTSDVARPALALANLRLGRWLPNPLNRDIRADLKSDDAEKKMRRRKGFGGSYDEFIPELFGLHQSDAARVYISDGGHYDNLGLIALLQARCKEIWCVDAQADPDGKASQLHNVLRLVRDELKTTSIDIDLSVLQCAQPGVLAQGYASGQILYPGGSTGRLVVIKLGLVAGVDEELFQYRSTNPGFAHHGTFWPPLRVMWYGPERFEKYRTVGYANALAASRAHPLPQAGSPA